jgi:D-alanine-D-alanine ligase
MARVGVLMGGTSAEREVSLTSGDAVLKALAEGGVDAVAIDTAEDWQTEIREKGIGKAFVALHGRGGEDGRIQGALDLLGIPYTGPGVMGSALAMDKIVSKRILRDYGISTPDFVELGPESHIPPAGLNLPVVVKPSREGSTIGITIVREEAELEGAIGLAASYDPYVLLEDFVEGEDLTVGVLNGEPMAVVQIVTESGFYDYETKYVTGADEYRVPAPIGEQATEKVRETARAAAKALRCCGGVRVDFRGLSDSYSVIDVNTIPGMTPKSLLPKSAAGVGIDFTSLVLEMLRTAGEGSR